MSTLTKINENLYKTESGVEVELHIEQEEFEMVVYTETGDEYELFYNPLPEEVVEWLRSFESNLTEDEIEGFGELVENYC